MSLEFAGWGYWFPAYAGMTTERFGRWLSSLLTEPFAPVFNAVPHLQPIKKPAAAGRLDWVREPLGVLVGPL